MTGADLRITQSPTLNLPTRASGSENRADSGVSLEQTDSLGPSVAAQPGASTEALPGTGPLIKPALKGDLAARLAGEALQASLAMTFGMVMPSVVGSLRVNHESGVFAMDKFGVLGTSTQYSLPGGTEVMHTNVPSFMRTRVTNDLISASRSQVVRGEDGQASIEKTELPVRIDADKNFQITNPDGTISVVNPKTLELEKREPSDVLPSQEKALGAMKQGLASGQPVLLTGPPMVGKSSLALMALGENPVRINLSADTSVQDLLGSYVIKDSQPEFQASGFAQGAASGKNVLIGLDHATEPVQQFLEHVLAHRECPATMLVDGPSGLTEAPIPPEQRFPVSSDTGFLAVRDPDNYKGGPRLNPDLAARFQHVTVPELTGEDLAHVAEKLAPNVAPGQRMGLALFHCKISDMTCVRELKSFQKPSLRAFHDCCKMADDLALQGDKQAVGKAVSAVYLQQAGGRDLEAMTHMGQACLGKGQI